MIDIDKPPLEAVYLAHVGVKGMKWGVRKSRESASQEKTSRFTPEQKARAKKVAIGTGILVLAIGTAYAGAKLKESGSLPVSSIRPPKPEVRKVVKDVQEQVDILHASRGQNRGFTFLRTGGLPNPLEEFESVFGNTSAMDVGVRRLSDGRVAAAFNDPEGRKDAATRTIPHQIIIPRSMSEGINTVDDVQSKIWPLLRDAHTDLYKQPPRI